MTDPTAVAREIAAQTATSFGEPGWGVTLEHRVAAALTRARQEGEEAMRAEHIGLIERAETAVQGFADDIDAAVERLRVTLAESRAAATLPLSTQPEEAK